MSSSNYCFLTCIQVSREAGQVVWYSHLFQNFPQFVVIHTVKGFGIVNKVEVDVFLQLSCFFYDLMDVGNLISASSTISKSSLNIWKFTVHVTLKPGLENFEHYFASMWYKCNCVVVWTFFGISFLWGWNEYWPFPVLWPLLSFPNLLAYWCSTFTASSFRVWNSSVGNSITSISFVLDDASKGPLGLAFQISDSTWVIIPPWLPGWKSILYRYSVYSCHLFLISSASLAPYYFCPLLCPYWH